MEKHIDSYINKFLSSILVLEDFKNQELNSIEGNKEVIESLKKRFG